MLRDGIDYKASESITELDRVDSSSLRRTHNTRRPGKNGT